MNADIVKRGIKMVTLVPLKEWKTTRRIHSELEQAGYIQSVRTTQRDLHNLALDFGLECRERKNAFQNELEWTRKRDLA